MYHGLRRLLCAGLCLPLLLPLLAFAPAGPDGSEACGCVHDAHHSARCPCGHAASTPGLRVACHGEVGVAEGAHCVIGAAPEAPPTSSAVLVVLDVLFRGVTGADKLRLPRPGHRQAGLPAAATLRSRPAAAPLEPPPQRFGLISVR